MKVYVGCTPIPPDDDVACIATLPITWQSVVLEPHMPQFQDGRQQHRGGRWWPRVSLHAVQASERDTLSWTNHRPAASSVMVLPGSRLHSCACCISRVVWAALRIVRGGAARRRCVLAAAEGRRSADTSTPHLLRGAGTTALPLGQAAVECEQAQRARAAGQPGAITSAKAGAWQVCNTTLASWHRCFLASLHVRVLRVSTW
jgi:hypothetical protein